MKKEIEYYYVGKNARCFGLPKESELHFFVDWENGNHESCACKYCGLSAEIDMGIRWDDDNP